MTISEEIQAMRATAEAMKSGPVKGVLRQWAERLEAALEAPVVPETPQPEHTGVFDVQAAQERQYWRRGVCTRRESRARVERMSGFKWGHYGDLPGGGA